ncbi:hypothetical protein [Cellulomonas hominis]
MATDGTLVYRAGDDAFTTAIQNDAAGVEIQTLLESEAPADALSYEIDGARPVLRADGGVDLVVASEGGAPQVGLIAATVDPPWAVDSSGRALPTRYVVEGDTIIQAIDTSSAPEYPVLADPRLSVGVGLYVSLNKTEIRAFATAAGALISGGASVACTVIGSRVKVPGITTLIKNICQYVSAAAVITFIESLPSRTESYYTSSCYQARIPPQSPAWKVVDSSQCSSSAWG